jgi:cardiolipin synthase
MLVTILTTAEIVYVVVLATWILFEKRPPIATLAWILALVALPYVGFLVFFVLGPRRLVRKRLKHRRARGRVKPAAGEVTPAPVSHPTPEDPRIAQLDRLATHAGEPPSDVCERVTILHDAASTYDAIEAAIRASEHHVHVAYYIFDSGRAGTRLCDALVERARAGLTVRVLVDDVGSSSMTRAMVKRMRDSGIKFARFNAVTFSRIRSRVDFRNHRKIVVCDGRVGFTGGINVCDDYVPESGPPPGRAIVPAPARRRRRRGHPAPWRDTHIRLEGDVVRWLQLTFLDDWHYVTRYVPREPGYFPPLSGKGKHRVQIVASGPDRDLEAIQKVYFAAIAIAQARVLVTTPYFVPDDAILAALTTAALRGVDVRILVPRRSDSLVVTAAARSYYDGVLAAGARVYEYQPTMIHAKTVVVDDFFAAVGTANMDNRSFRLNFEVTAVLYGREHANELAEQFRIDLKDAREVKKQAREKVPLRWRVAEAGARVLSPLL